jgi:hypothetical protein
MIVDVRFIQKQNELSSRRKLGEKNGRRWRTPGT